jgi:predicted permease
VGISVYLNLIVSKMLRFDFSGDLDHMDVLRSLPLSGTSVALAQLTTPVFIISAIQLTLLTTIAVTGRLPTEHLAGIVAFAVPLNFLSVGLDNLLFLLFPFRAQTAVAGDMTLVGRQAIVFACRLFLMVIVAGVAVGIGAATWALTGRSVTVAAAVAWLPLAGAVAAIVWLTGWAYSRFDPSISTPVGA